MRLLIFLRSTRRRSLPFGFFCAKIGVAYFENGNVAIIPYLCSSANSDIMSSLRFTGVGGIRLYAGGSSFGVSLMVISSFIPMSSLWRANMSWKDGFYTRKFSISAIFCLLSMESFQSKLFENCCLNCSFSRGLSCSNCCKLGNSASILFWIGV